MLFVYCIYFYKLSYLAIWNYNGRLYFKLKGFRHLDNITRLHCIYLQYTRATAIKRFLFNKQQKRLSKFSAEDWVSVSQCFQLNKIIMPPKITRYIDKLIPYRHWTLSSCIICWFIGIRWHLHPIATLISWLISRGVLLPLASHRQMDGSSRLVLSIHQISKLSYFKIRFSVSWYIIEYLTSLLKLVSL